jgi:hypothetical protein
VGKGDQTTSKIEGIRIEYFCFVKAAVEWAARNKFHKACKPLTNYRQVDTKHVKDASCAVATSSCEISLPFFQGIYNRAGWCLNGAKYVFTTVRYSI